MSVTASSSLRASNLSAPDVSVIIPTHNRLSMLEDALASAFAQDFDGAVEILVVDDNSQDDTSEVVSQKYPDVRLISLKETVGAYVARNRALSEARGTYIAFLDSDDLWEPNYLETQINALEGQEQCFSVSAIIVWYKNEDRKVISIQKPDLARFTSPIHELLVQSSFIYTPSSVIFSRNVFDEVGLFDETFRVGADREFYLRCLIAGYHPIFTEQPLATCQKHGNQLTQINASNIELRKNTRLAYLEKHIEQIKSKVPTISTHRIQAEIYSTSAREYFRERYFLRWIYSSIKLAEYSSPRYALLNMIRDILRPIKKYLPSRILNTIRHRFLSGSLST